MVQSSKLSGSVRAYQAQENDHREHRNARYSSHEHLPPNSSNHVAILPGGPAHVNGPRVTLASVLRYRVPEVHRRLNSVSAASLPDRPSESAGAIENLRRAHDGLHVVLSQVQALNTHSTRVSLRAESNPLWAVHAERSRQGRSGGGFQTGAATHLNNSRRHTSRTACREPAAVH